MSFYMIVNSDRCSEYFPTNTAYRFSTYLKFPLALTGSWKVALAEIKVSDNRMHADSHRDVYVYSSICEESIVDGEKQSLLRRLFHNDGDYATVLPTLFYVPVKENEIDRFDVYIKDGDGNYASFLKGSTSVTLHFKKYPFVA